MRGTEVETGAEELASEVERASLRVSSTRPEADRTCPETRDGPSEVMQSDWGLKRTDCAMSALIQVKRRLPGELITPQAIPFLRRD
jgi:hypothetical protein